ncbi:MAG TPA: hypothetical protein VJQ82_08730 [Terriglobales bacterium]|nr:hypothetical protein [Terriglobales bacterium]
MIIDTESHGPTAVADIALCKMIYETLLEHYPNHPWLIGANSESGAADIKLLYTDPRNPRTNWGYSLNLNSLVTHDERKRKIVRAGGELLERYGLARNGAREDSLLRAIEHGLDTSH